VIPLRGRQSRGRDPTWGDRLDHRHRQAPVRTHPPRPWWKRRAAKLSAVITPAVAAVLGAWFLWLAGPPGSAAPATPAPAPSTAAQPAAGQPGKTAPAKKAAPLLIEDVRTEFWQDYSFAAATGSPLSQPQLSRLNSRSNPLNLPPLPGVVMANKQWITLTVAGNDAAPVTINGMDIIKHCQQPLHGSLFYSPTAGAGPFPFPSIGFNLDQQVSIGQYLPAPGKKVLPAGGNFFAKEVVTLKYHEPQTLGIYVTTNRQYCQYTFQLNVATASGPVTQVITDNGRPFALTADGEGGTPGVVRFSAFSVVYAGGVANPQGGDRFVRVNPGAYRGAGHPLTPVSSP
jgi:hypothetical protein